MTSYQSLAAWKVSMRRIKAFYRSVKIFPKEELFGPSDQTRRAANSIAAHISEGMGRHHKKNTTHFLYISRGSARS